MSTQMTVLYLAETGHVLAALRQLDDAPPKLATLVGTGFPLRVTQTSPTKPISAAFVLPPDDKLLMVTSAVLDERVLGRPQAFVVDNDRVQELPPPLGLTITLAAATLTVKGTTPLVKTKIFAAVRTQDASSPLQRLMGSEWQDGANNVPMNLKTSPSGPDAALPVGVDCDVVVALAGYPLFWLTDTTA